MAAARSRGAVDTTAAGRSLANMEMMHMRGESLKGKRGGFAQVARAAGRRDAVAARRAFSAAGDRASAARVREMARATGVGGSLSLPVFVVSPCNSVGIKSLL